jgi:hypothetical protein
MAAGVALAGSPPPTRGGLGAYQEPSPRPEPVQKAAAFVNTILKRDRTPTRVTVPQLQAGVALETAAKVVPGPATGPRPSRPKPMPKPRPSSARAARVVAPRSQAATTPRLTSRPVVPTGAAAPVARAGVSEARDQTVPGLAPGLIVAGLLAGLGLALEVGRKMGRVARAAGR